MKRVNLFIKCSGAFTVDTLCCRVMVGTSERDTKARTWLTDYSAAHGYYFRPWDHETQHFYDNLRHSVSDDGELISCILDISELKRLLTQAKFDVFAERFVHAVRGASNFLCANDAYAMARHRANLAVSLSTSTLPPAHVINLK